MISIKVNEEFVKNPLSQQNRMKEKQLKSIKEAAKENCEILFVSFFNYRRLRNT